PASRTVVAGNATTYSIDTTVVAAAGTVALTVSGLPAGVTGSFSATSVAAGPSSTLTVTTTTGAAAGSTSFTVTGTEGTFTHSTSATLVITPAPDFTIFVNPASQTLQAGFSTTYTITTTQVLAAGTVALSVSGLPAGATGSFSPTSVA